MDLLVIWHDKEKVLQRIVLRRWGIYQQHLCMDVNTGVCCWRDVPWFKRKKK